MNITEFTLQLLFKLLLSINVNCFFLNHYHQRPNKNTVNNARINHFTNISKIHDNKPAIIRETLTPNYWAISQKYDCQMHQPQYISAIQTHYMLISKYVIDSKTSILAIAACGLLARDYDRRALVV